MVSGRQLVVETEAKRAHRVRKEKQCDSLENFTFVVSLGVIVAREKPEPKTVDVTCPFLEQTRFVHSAKRD